MSHNQDDQDHLHLAKIIRKSYEFLFGNYYFIRKSILIPILFIYAAMVSSWWNSQLKDPGILLYMFSIFLVATGVSLQVLSISRGIMYGVQSFPGVLYSAALLKLIFCAVLVVGGVIYLYGYGVDAVFSDILYTDGLLSQGMQGLMVAGYIYLFIKPVFLFPVIASLQPEDYHDIRRSGYRGYLWNGLLFSFASSKKHFLSIFASVLLIAGPAMFVFYVGSWIVEFIAMVFALTLGIHFGYLMLIYFSFVICMVVSVSAIAISLCYIDILKNMEVDE